MFLTPVLEKKEDISATLATISTNRTTHHRLYREQFSLCQYKQVAQLGCSRFASGTDGAEDLTIEPDTFLVLFSSDLLYSAAMD